MANYNASDPFTQVAINLQTPHCLPPLLWGTFGAGKSEMLAQLVAQLELGSIETLIGSCREPGDFAMPFPNGDGLSMEPAAEIKRLMRAERGVLFLDELTCSAPATQSVMMRIALDGECGSAKWDREAIKVISAANPPDEATGGWDLAYPLANRFHHIHIGLMGNDQWAQWMLDGPGDPQYPRVDRKAWSNAWPKARALIATYMRTAALGVSTQEKASLFEPEKAFGGRFPPAIARPRTWECAARLVASALAIGDDELVFPLVAGAVGEPQAVSFAAWMRSADLPDPEELLADPNRFRPDKKRLDRVFATLSMVAAVATDKNRAQNKADLAKRWEAAWHVVGKAMNHGKDLCVMAARQLVATENRQRMSPEVIAIIEELRPVTFAARNA